MDLDTSIILNRDLVKIIHRIVNSVDTDETTHLDLYCLQRCLYWSTGFKELKTNTSFVNNLSEMKKSDKSCIVLQILSKSDKKGLQKFE